MDTPLSGDQRPVPNQHPLADYQFSAEEMRVLKDCNTESFFQRSLPFGTGLGLLAYFGVKNGYLRGNGKYGAVPKVVLGVILGYFVGKFSYQQKCAEKIMRLPNSRLGDLLRERRQGGGIMNTISPDENLGRALTLAPFKSSAADIYSDESFQPTRGSALNLDTESRPSVSGLDDIYRPSLDDPNNTIELPFEPPKLGQSYDDLRKKNREEHLKQHQSPYSRAPEPPAQPRHIEPSVDSARATKNKYGDSWTD